MRNDMRQLELTHLTPGKVVKVSSVLVDSIGSHLPQVSKLFQLFGLGFLAFKLHSVFLFCYA